MKTRGVVIQWPSAKDHRQSTFPFASWVLPSARNGFTLLELIAALTLASLMTLALWRLLSITLATQQQIPVSTETNRQWVQRTLDLLEQDFQVSTNMEITRTSIHLDGFAGTTTKSLQPFNQPAVVTWSVDDTGHLIRQQRLKSSRTNRRPTRHLLASNISELSLWFADAPHVPWLSEQTSTTQSPVPTSLIVQLTTSGKDAHTTRRYMLLKAGK